MIMALKKERKKVKKYKYFTREIQRLWRTSANETLIIVGALETVASLDEYMRMLDIEQREVDGVVD